MPDLFTVLQQIIAELVGRLGSAARVGQLTPASALTSVAQFEPLIVRTLRDSLLANYLDAARQSATSAGLPVGNPGGPPPWDVSARVTDGGAEPVARLPMLEAAVEDLARRGVLTREDYDRLDQDARRTAFTVARIGSIDALRRVQTALAENLQSGGTLKDFAREVEATVDTSALGSGQLETVYRTQTAAAYSAGQRAILADPLVGDAFPYVEWSATHDSRVRPDHLEMEKHGQGGTAVYRTDDPIWDVLYPPAGYNCRCVLIPLSIADAAAKGSPEAKAWLASGEPPVIPDYAALPYPITPPEGWPTHSRIQSVL